LEAVLIVAIVFGSLASLVIVPVYLRAKERERMQENVRLAIEKGQALPTDIVDTISRSARLPPSPQKDLRTGIIWLGVAVGLAAFGIAMGFEEPDMTFPMIAFAAFPGFIGAAFIVLGLINRPKV
jgi:hypothetical protein